MSVFRGELLPVPDGADAPLVAGRSCEFCNLPATFSNSVPDINACGANFHEPGYRRQYLCWLHAREADRENTSRVLPLTEEDAPETEECRTCGGTGEYCHNPCDDFHIEILACDGCDGTGRVPAEAERQ